MPRHPDSSQDVLPNLPRSSPACSGAICWSASCSASPSDQTPAKSHDVPAPPQPPSCNFIPNRMKRQPLPPTTQSAGGATYVSPGRKPWGTETRIRPSPGGAAQASNLRSFLLPTPPSILRPQNSTQDPPLHKPTPQGWTTRLCTENTDKRRTIFPVTDLACVPANC